MEASLAIGGITPSNAPGTRAGNLVEQPFSDDIPLYKQFKQGTQAGDCQTIEALKVLSTGNPSRIRGMIRREGNHWVVTFPKLSEQAIKNSLQLLHFDYWQNVITVTDQDIRDFKPWYWGKSKQGSLGQAIIQSALLKRFQNGVTGQNYSSVGEYIKDKKGLTTAMLTTSDIAFFVLSGTPCQVQAVGFTKYQRLNSDKAEGVGLVKADDSSLAGAARAEKQKYLDEIRGLFLAHRIVAASQFLPNDQPLPEGDNPASYAGTDRKKFDANGDGIVEGHAYGLSYDASDDAVTIHNPWGEYEPFDPQGAALDGKNDGVFKMSLPEFARRFTSYTLTQPDEAGKPVP